MRPTLIAAAVALSLTIIPMSTVAAEPGGATVNDLIDRGAAALTRHDFALGLDLGQEARALAPASSQPLGIIVDALIELGRYDEAGEALQSMLRTRPDLASYARLSYFHELHGRLDLAIDAMERALVAGGTTVADTEFARLHLADLWLLAGDPERAGELYATTLRLQPDRPAALAWRESRPRAVTLIRLPTSSAQLSRLSRCPNTCSRSETSSNSQDRVASLVRAMPSPPSWSERMPLQARSQSRIAPFWRPTTATRPWAWPSRETHTRRRHRSARLTHWHGPCSPPVISMRPWLARTRRLERARCLRRSCTTQV